ncbi:hypothetical protein Psfp_01689 [Pelotomaculum sp. FP]|nr:hypothetical protein Psfp_01689 [Pelotomaculum sp. FP]
MRFKKCSFFVLLVVVFLTFKFDTLNLEIP